MIESSKAREPGSCLTYGMVGGGEGAFIGYVHRKAIAFDGNAGIVCGCFSTNPENTLKTGIGIGLGPERLYSTYEEMAAAEGKGRIKLTLWSL